MTTQARQIEALTPATIRSYAGTVALFRVHGGPGKMRFRAVYGPGPSSSVHGYISTDSYFGTVVTLSSTVETVPTLVDGKWVLGAMTEVDVRGQSYVRVYGYVTALSFTCIAPDGTVLDANPGLTVDVIFCTVPIHNMRYFDDGSGLTYDVVGRYGGVSSLNVTRQTFPYVGTYGYYVKPPSELVFASNLAAMSCLFPVNPDHEYPYFGNGLRRIIADGVSGGIPDAAFSLCRNMSLARMRSVNSIGAHMLSQFSYMVKLAVGRLDSIAASAFEDVTPVDTEGWLAIDGYDTGGCMVELDASMTYDEFRTLTGWTRPWPGYQSHPWGAEYLLVRCTDRTFDSDGYFYRDDGRRTSEENVLIDDDGRYVNEAGEYVLSDGVTRCLYDVDGGQYEVNADGRIVDYYGRLMNARGHLVNEGGAEITEDGDLVDENHDLTDVNGIVVCHLDSYDGYYWHYFRRELIDGVYRDVEYVYDDYGVRMSRDIRDRRVQYLTMMSPVDMDTGVVITPNTRVKIRLADSGFMTMAPVRKEDLLDPSGEGRDFPSCGYLGADVSTYDRGFRIVPTMWDEVHEEGTEWEYTQSYYGFASSVGRNVAVSTGIPTDRWDGTLDPYDFIFDLTLGRGSFSVDIISQPETEYGPFVPDYHVTTAVKNERSFAGRSTLNLFSCKSSDMFGMYEFRFYEMFVYEGDTLVRHYLPWADRDGNAMFKDVVGGKDMISEYTGCIDVGPDYEE